MSQGTPAASQIIILESRVSRLTTELELAHLMHKLVVAERDYERVVNSRLRLESGADQLAEMGEVVRKNISRRVKVENKLLLAKDGLTAEQCVALALELGTPV